MKGGRTTLPWGRPAGLWPGALLLAALLPPLRAASADAPASSPTQRFEAANALYETGRHGDAAAAYQAMAEEGLFSPTLYLNLGNAWYKAGQRGRAVAAYRLGLQRAPRDPDLRFNLNHVRESLRADAVPVARGWSSWLGRLTLDEWTVLFLVPYWSWGLLLIAGEWRPSFKTSLRGYTASAGVVAGLLLVCLILAAGARTGQLEAVVTAPEAVVRLGPLEASQMKFQLTDGAEVEVLDRKEGEPPWVRVRAADGQEGWVKLEEVALVQPPGVRRD